MIFTMQSLSREKIYNISVWRLNFLREDSKYHVQMLSEDAMGWRAAEYGIPFEDSDTLLDLLIHEPYMTHLHQDHPKFLWNVDQKEAREYHLEQLENVKKIHQHVDPKNLFEDIKKSYDPWHSAHIEKIDYVAAHRQRLSSRGAK